MSFAHPTVDHRYILEKYVGHGGTSKVFLAEGSEGNVAVKVIRKDKGFSKEDEKQLVSNECKIMNEIGYHPNIINLLNHNLEGYEYIQQKVYDISYTVVEYCPNGSLYDHIKKNGPLEEAVACFYFKQLVYAMKHLHDKNIAHCDIKPGNIFLDEFFNLKVADLGCAMKMKSKNYGITKCFGTKTYMAPEVFKASLKTPFSPFAADVYAIGATLYFMLTGKTPQSAETSETASQETDDIYSPSNTYIGDLDCLDLLTLDMVERWTAKDPTERPAVEQIMEHPWLDDNGNIDLGYQVYEYMSANKEADVDMALN